MARFVYADKAGAPGAPVRDTEEKVYSRKEAEEMVKKAKKDQLAADVKCFDVEKGKLQAENEKLKLELRESENRTGSKTMHFRRSFSGSTIVFKEGRMYVDGKVMEYDDNGQKMGYVDDVHITGDVERVQTMSGSVTVEGNATRVNTMSGGVTVKGKCDRVSTMSGSIMHG